MSLPASVTPFAHLWTVGIFSEHISTFVVGQPIYLQGICQNIRLSTRIHISNILYKNETLWQLLELQVFPLTCEIQVSIWGLATFYCIFTTIGPKEGKNGQPKQRQKSSIKHCTQSQGLPSSAEDKRTKQRNETKWQCSSNEIWQTPSPKNVCFTKNDFSDILKRFKHHTS